MNEVVESKLAGEIQEGAIVRDFCKHSGFAIFKKELDAKINDLKNSWLSADADQADKFRIRAQVYNEVLDILKAKIIRGDTAARAMQIAKENSDQI
jgi:hypothetical protein